MILFGILGSDSYTVRTFSQGKLLGARLQMITFKYWKVSDQLNQYSNIERIKTRIVVLAYFSIIFVILISRTRVHVYLLYKSYLKIRQCYRAHIIHVDNYALTFNFYCYQMFFVFVFFFILGLWFFFKWNITFLLQLIGSLYSSQLTPC
jgi:hypothetical protein